jgi:D-alanine-D-alanine ligase
LRIGVLQGGDSLERGVSLRSAAQIELALVRLGHIAVPIEPGPDLVELLRKERPELAFVALRGGGEDGTVQELLEILDIPYTGSPAGVCGRCMDRILAKHELREAGVPTPDWFALAETAFRELGAADALGELEHRLGFPLAVKPSHGGSALGTEVAKSWFDVPAALISAFDFDERVLLERFVPGPALTVRLLDGEILGGVEAAAGDAAAAAYRVLGCAGFVEVAIILGENGPQVLEVDPAPTVTDAGPLSIDDLVAKILALATR